MNDLSLCTALALRDMNIFRGNYPCHAYARALHNVIDTENPNMVRFQMDTLPSGQGSLALK